MAEPAEVLLIKDQYELAFHALTRGLAAEEAEKKDEALGYYRKGRQHLTQGVDVPTMGERQKGAVWDMARKLQQKMSDTLKNVDAHVSKLETSHLTTGEQRGQLLKNLPTPSLYPDLAPDSQPPQSTVHHLYPTVSATTQDKTPTPNTPPPRPPAPVLPQTHSVPAEAGGTTVMANPVDQPPAYTPQATHGHHSLVGSGNQTQTVTGENVSELLSIPSGVQLFFVGPNGQVSSLSSPGFLRIIVCNAEPPSTKPTAFLHVCDWLYPLTTDTPVLLANSGIFMFPDYLAGTPESYAGVVLSSELPAVDREAFQDLLSQISEFRIQNPAEEGSEIINLSSKIPLESPIKETASAVSHEGEQDKALLPGWSEKIGQGILSGAWKLSESLIRGAEATGRMIHRGAAKLRDHMTPEETPSEVNPRTARNLEVAEKATGTAVKVSKKLVDGVSMVAEKMAEKVAPHVKKHGSKLVPEALKKKEDGQASNMDGAKFVAASSVQGFSAVWSSLETGAKLIGKSVVAETVTTVTYKFRGLENLINLSRNT
ncbi:spartin a isoform 2-T3 [Pholidichthys leucotaenia]